MILLSNSWIEQLAAMTDVLDKLHKCNEIGSLSQSDVGFIYPRW